MELGYPKVFLKKGKEKIVSFHPWIFSGAIAKEESLEPGGVCFVCSYSGEFLGMGYWNPHSDIRIRILSLKPEKIDEFFFIQKFKEALQRKLVYISHTNAYRWIHGEGDGLPGLIIDVYNNNVVVQIHTLGMEKLKPFILKAILSTQEVNVVYEKSDTEARKKEGLSKINTGLLWGEKVNLIEIYENEFKFIVDIVHGQKTGFFLDQRENRAKILKYLLDKSFINCFCYTGAFSVYAAKITKKIKSIDISSSALDLAKENFKINGFNPENYEFIKADVFEYLKSLENEQQDAILIDPPSLAKNKNSLPQAWKAYVYLNSMALKALKSNGILISSSCTSHITDSMFLDILLESASIANCKLQILDVGIQPQDHPWILNFPEGKYLKFYILLKLPKD